MLRKIVAFSPLGLSILALTLALSTFLLEFRQQETRTEFLVVDPAQGEGAVLIPPNTAEQLARQLDEMERVTRQAESASQSADAILSFIEGGSILLVTLISIAVVVFGAGIQDVRGTVKALGAEASQKLQESEIRFSELFNKVQQEVQVALENGENRLRESEAQVLALTKRIEAALANTENISAQVDQSIQQAVDSAKREAENSFRVLSLLLLAEQQVRARNRKTAIVTLEEAYKLDPENQTTNYLLGYLYVGRRQFEKATMHLNKALEKNPDFAPALAALGLAQQRMGASEQDDLKRRQLWAQAEFNLTKALENDSGLIDADNESYFGTLGGLYRRQGRNADAMKAYEEAVKVTPNNSYPVGNLALLYKLLGHEDKAYATYQHAIKIAETILNDQPNDTWARLDLAQALLVTGQRQKALQQYHDVIDRIQEVSTLESALSGLKALEDAPQAVNGLDEARQLLRNAIEKFRFSQSSGMIPIPDSLLQDK